MAQLTYAFILRQSVGARRRTPPGLLHLEVRSAGLVIDAVVAQKAPCFIHVSAVTTVALLRAGQEVLWREVEALRGAPALRPRRSVRGSANAEAVRQGLNRPKCPATAAYPLVTNSRDRAVTHGPRVAGIKLLGHSNRGVRLPCLESPLCGASSAPAGETHRQTVRR